MQFLSKIVPVDRCPIFRYSYLLRSQYKVFICVLSSEVATLKPAVKNDEHIKQKEKVKCDKEARVLISIN